LRGWRAMMPDPPWLRSHAFPSPLAHLPLDEFAQQTSDRSTDFAAPQNNRDFMARHA